MCAARDGSTLEVSPTDLFTPEVLMSIRTIQRFAATAVVTGCASLALAAPASAMVDPAPPPNPGGRSLSDGSVVVVTDDSPWLEIGIGALAGLAIAGAGVAVASAARGRSAVPTT
jgi:hypothetical protein